MKARIGLILFVSADVNFHCRVRSPNHSPGPPRLPFHPPFIVYRSSIVASDVFYFIRFV